MVLNQLHIEQKTLTLSYMCLLRHKNHIDISKVSKEEMVRGLSKLDKSQNTNCSGCQLGKQTRGHS